MGNWCLPQMVWPQKWAIRQLKSYKFWSILLFGATPMDRRPIEGCVETEAGCHWLHCWKVHFDPVPNSSPSVQSHEARNFSSPFHFVNLLPFNDWFLVTYPPCLVVSNYNVIACLHPQLTPDVSADEVRRALCLYCILITHFLLLTTGIITLRRFKICSKSHFFL